MVPVPFDDIKAGTPVLTVNNRLARHIRFNYDMQLARSGVKVWQTPLILPLSVWLEEQRNLALPLKPLLSRAGSRVLWEEIVSGDPPLAGRGLLFREGIARRAGEAWRLLREYDLKPGGGAGLPLRGGTGAGALVCRLRTEACRSGVRGSSRGRHSLSQAGVRRRNTSAGKDYPGRFR